MKEDRKSGKNASREVGVLKFKRGRRRSTCKAVDTWMKIKK